MNKRIDKPIYLPITRIKDENKYVKTFHFKYSLSSKPGQFIMLWIPDIDQKPFSIKSDDDVNFSISVFKLGALTNKLFELKVGDRVGISGPYGNPFSVKENKNYIMIAGGYGAAPLAYLSTVLSTKNSTINFCVGARNEELILFEKEISQLPNVTVHVATDDGSSGHKGYVTDFIESTKADIVE